MSDDDSAEVSEYKLFANRPEWRDVVPVPQDDGPKPACPIAYTEAFQDAMSYFRAVLQRQELSERALVLTRDVIDLNASNYTVWHFRRLVLAHLQADLTAELSYIGEIIRENQKNYQVWYHRRVIVERLGDASHELEFTKNILADDSKNYHAWTHRQWVMETFKLWDGALAYVDLLLDTDVRNNSAWCHRYFILSHTEGFTAQVGEREVAYALQRLSLAPSNESAHNYLRGICRRLPIPGLRAHPAIAELVSRLRAEPSPPPLVLALHLDLLVEDMEGGSEEARAAALATCELLQTADEIRARYWAHRAAIIGSGPV